MPTSVGRRHGLRQQVIGQRNAREILDHHELGRLSFDELEHSAQAIVADVRRGFRLPHDGGHLAWLFLHGAGQEIERHRVAGRQVHGAIDSLEPAAFVAVEDLVLAEQERTRFSGQQYGRLIAAEHAAGHQPFGQRDGVALICPRHAAEGRIQALAIFARQQSAIDGQLPEIVERDGHIAGALLTRKEGSLLARMRLLSARVPVLFLIYQMYRADTPDCKLAQMAGDEGLAATAAAAGDDCRSACCSVARLGWLRLNRRL